MRQSERRRPAVNLAPCICAAAVVYKSTLPCYAQCKTRPCLADASTDADKRFAYVDKTYLMCYIQAYNKILFIICFEKFSQKLGQYQKIALAQKIIFLA